MHPSVLVLLSMLLFARVLAQPLPHAFHDPLDDASPWKVVTADGVSLLASVEPRPELSGSCLRLDYDFSRGSGYAIIRREFPADSALTIPANYRVALDLRGEGPRNTLEFKLVQRVDAPDGSTGEDVWWVNRRDFAFAGPWRPLVLPKRRFSFAWGPGGGNTPLTRAHAIEFVITSFNGGKGTVWIDNLRLEPLPAPPAAAVTAPPTVTVSSRAEAEPGKPPLPLAIADDGFLGWRSSAGDADAAPTATIDFGAPREFGGLILEWEVGRAPVDYTISADSPDGPRALASIRGTNGGRDFIAITDGLAQRLTIACTAANATDGVGLRSVRVQPPEFGDAPDALIKAAAAESPRGWWPRPWIDKAQYWTVAGADADTAEALISEDGAIEPGTLAPSIEPFVSSGGRLLTWNEFRIAQRLADDYLPIPAVTRELTARSGAVGLQLDIECFADDAPPITRARSCLFMRYRLTNTGRERHAGTLHLAVRPLQVNPPYQFLNTPGGIAPLRSIRRDGRTLHLDQRRLVMLDPAPSVSAWAFEQGEIIEHLAAPVPPARTSDSCEDPAGLASAAMHHPFDLAPGASLTIHLLAPLHPSDSSPLAPASEASPADIAALYDARRDAVAAAWRARLDSVRITLPSAARHWWDAARANLAYILINRDGPGLQPGSRAYERTWIRDGALTSSAMLAFGLDREVVEFLDWFAPFQYDNGKIPCCVDRRGPDPVPEHDSHGQYIYAVMNTWRYTGDTGFLRRHFPRVIKAAEYIELLRRQRMTPEFSSPDAPPAKRVLYGLVPESISHEGYSAKPMHSYWDDLWAAKGLEDAAAMARVLGEVEHASRLDELAADFRRTLRDSIALAMQIRKIPYIPGCAELGDFDATSTTIGLWPCDQFRAGGESPDSVLSRKDLEETFDKYHAYFASRRDAVGQAADWTNYTPYEWRVMGAMIRLGIGSPSGDLWRYRAHEIAGFLFADSRPAAWNHWAEVVWRDPRRAAFIGDMPHTWCGSDFINSFRAILAVENDHDASMIIGAGIPVAWLLSADGLRVEGLRTHFGRLDLDITRTDPTTRIAIGGDLRMPEGGLFFTLPALDMVSAVRIDGAPAAPAPLLRLQRLPAVIEIDYPD